MKSNGDLLRFKDGWGLPESSPEVCALDSLRRVPKQKSAKKKDKKRISGLKLAVSESTKPDRREFGSANRKIFPIASRGTVYISRNS